MLVWDLHALSHDFLYMRLRVRVMCSDQPPPGLHAHRQAANRRAAQSRQATPTGLLPDRENQAHLMRCWPLHDVMERPLPRNPTFLLSFFKIFLFQAFQVFIVFCQKRTTKPLLMLSRRSEEVYEESTRILTADSLFRKRTVAVG